MKFDIITIGGSVKDFIFFTNQGKIFSNPDDLTAQRLLAFEYGAKINIKEFYCTLGGGAANTAVAFSRLGLKTGTVTRIGQDDNGRGIFHYFKKEKVSPNFIQTDKKTPTGFSFILAEDKKDKEHIAFLYRGANENLNFNQSVSDKIKTPWLYLTSLSGRDWFKTLKSIFDYAKINKLKIGWNPGNWQLQAGHKILANFLTATTVLILNKDEAIELVLSGIKVGRRNPRYLNKPLYLLNILKDWGPKIVVITDGEKGAWVYDGKKIYHQAGRKIKVVNTVGVGDAFAATFIGSYIINHGDLAKSLQWGLINSASVLGKIGAQTGLMTLKELKKYE